MAEDDRQTLLRAQYLSQTARIAWTQLQTYYAGGSVIRVGESLNLVEVAVQLGMDNTKQFEQWIADGLVAPVADDEALAWYQNSCEVWAVVAPPWVLVQDRRQS